MLRCVISALRHGDGGAIPGDDIVAGSGEDDVVVIAGSLGVQQLSAGGNLGKALVGAPVAGVDVYKFCILFELLLLCPE